MRIITAGILLLFTGLGTQAEAAKAKAKEAQITDRKIVRETIAELREHPQGEKLVARKKMLTLELGGGEKVLATYEKAHVVQKMTVDNYNRPVVQSVRNVPATIRVHGRVGRGDVALFLLDAKERGEVTDIISKARASMRGKKPFKIKFDKARSGQLKIALAKKTAKTSRASRNLLAIRGLR
jgi:hypothetical protein